MKSRSRPIYIIGPSLWQCHQTAVAYGLNPERMEGVRSITHAQALRGAVPGTPFLASKMNGWNETETGWQLAQAVYAMVRTGRLRVASDDDIANSVSCNANIETAK